VELTHPTSDRGYPLTADGSRVASRFRVTGRNDGMFGLPVDGKPVAFTGSAILAVTPGAKLVRSCVERSAWKLYGRPSPR
jgi:hypothetical protein